MAGIERYEGLVDRAAASSSARILGVVSFRRNLTLYGYQREALDYILAREKDGAMENMRCHIALNEPFGSGKTFIILALIMESPIVPYFRSIPIYFDISHPTYVITPTLDNQIIRPTAIVVARSVFAQYVYNINNYTSLHVFEVCDITDCDKLNAAMINGDINSYDVVIIKHGTTSARGKLTDLCCKINELVFPRVWSRVVYDDSDAIERAICLRAMSSIFVTGAVDHKYMCSYPRNMLTFNDLITNHNTRKMLDRLPPVSHIGTYTCPKKLNDRGDMIWAYYGHSPNYIAQFTRLYGIMWRVVSIQRDDVHHASILIEGLDGNNRALLDMINSDACETAARALHIESSTPYALFAAVLGAQHEDHKTLNARVYCITNVIRRAGEHGVIHYDTTGLAKDQCDIACRSIRDERDHTFAINSICAQDIDEIRAQIAQLDRSFERIAENIAEETCLICYSELKQENVIIMRCCGFISCLSCCMRAGQFVSNNHNEIVGRCPQCRRAVNVRDLIMVKGSDRLLQFIDNVAKGNVIEAPQQDAATSAAASNIKTKVEYITRFARGETIETSDDNTIIVNDSIVCPHYINIAGILTGDSMVPSEAELRKVIICASQDETLSSIAAGIDDSCLEYRILRGSIYEFARELHDFAHGSVNILLLNIDKLWSGIDLQMAIDIMIVSAKWTQHLGQIIGRAQRIGRSCSLRVHILEYVANE
jgi:hypothetical protein